MCCYTTLWNTTIRNWHKLHIKYNKMSSYLSLTQLKTLPVQRVTDVVTEFVQNVPLLPHTGSKSYAQLINCAVNNILFHAMPNIQETLLQLIHIVNAWVTDRHAAERCPRFCSQLGLGRGCSEATDLGKWTLALSAPEIWQYRGLCVRVRCPVKR